MEKEKFLGAEISYMTFYFSYRKKRALAEEGSIMALLLSIVA